MLSDHLLEYYTGYPYTIFTVNILYYYTLQDKMIESSTDIIVLDKVEGLKMGVFGSGKLHNYGSESENKLTVTVFDELEFSVTVEKGYCLFSSPNIYNFLGYN